jgi:N-acetylglutamate synthase-like GNAT family acetyltransferase
VTEVYVVTDTAEDFFVKLGFDRVGTLDALPPAFRTHVTYGPETASVLRLLSPPP